MVAKHKRQDVRGVPAKDTGRERNSSSAQRVAAAVSRHLARQCDDEPSSGTRSLMGLAGKNMEELRPQMQQVNAFLSEASLRKASGELDRKTFSAEVAPASVVHALFDTLEVLVDRAAEAADKPSLQAATWASGTLAEHLRTSGYILSKRKYPDVPVLRTAMVTKRKERARQLYESVLENPDVKAALKRLDVAVLSVNVILNPPQLV